jgi:hypothetical protein
MNKGPGLFGLVFVLVTCVINVRLSLFSWVSELFIHCLSHLRLIRILLQRQDKSPNAATLPITRSRGRASQVRPFLSPTACCPGAILCLHFRVLLRPLALSWVKPQIAARSISVHFLGHHSPSLCFLIDSVQSPKPVSSLAVF